jgi:hypothetical protein
MIDRRLAKFVKFPEQLLDTTEACYQTAWFKYDS